MNMKRTLQCVVLRKILNIVNYSYIMCCVNLLGFVKKLVQKILSYTSYSKRMMSFAVYTLLGLSRDKSCTSSLSAKTAEHLIRRDLDSQMFS